jgi:predicted nucleic acid-binding protein
MDDRDIQNENKKQYENMNTRKCKNCIENTDKEQKEEEYKKDGDSGSTFDTNSSTKPAEWTIENEAILVEWCDIAQCYKWLNYQSFLKYSIWQAWFTIPVIIMSTVTGTAAFAQSSFTDTQKFYVQFGIGTINILVGILSTVSQYLKIAQLTEAHRVSSISWDKYARNIRIELAKAPEERMDAAHFMKLSRHEFDRMMETSPIIQSEIIEEFKKHFMGEDGTDQRRLYVELRKPDICDTIMTANTYRHKWYEQPVINNTNNTLLLSNQVESHNTESNNNITQLSSNQIIVSKDTIQQVFKENIFTVAKKMKSNKEKIEKYVENFKELYGRVPLQSEIIEHFKNELDKITLDRYFDSSDETELPV